MKICVTFGMLQLVNYNKRLSHFQNHFGVCIFALRQSIFRQPSNNFDYGSSCKYYFYFHQVLSKVLDLYVYTRNIVKYKLSKTLQGTAFNFLAIGGLLYVVFLSGMMGEIQLPFEKPTNETSLEVTNKHG